MLVEAAVVLTFANDLLHQGFADVAHGRQAEEDRVVRWERLGAYSAKDSFTSGTPTVMPIWRASFR
jgi:hypothetical protein